MEGDTLERTAIGGRLIADDTCRTRIVRRGVNTYVRFAPRKKEKEVEEEEEVCCALHASHFYRYCASDSCGRLTRHTSLSMGPFRNKDSSTMTALHWRWSVGGALLEKFIRLYQFHELSADSTVTTVSSDRRLHVMSRLCHVCQPYALILSSYRHHV